MSEWININQPPPSYLNKKYKLKFEIWKYGKKLKIGESEDVMHYDPMSDTYSPESKLDYNAHYLITHWREIDE